MRNPLKRLSETVESVSAVTEDVRGMAAEATDEVRAAALLGLVAFGAVALVAVLALAMSTAALARAR